MSNVIANTMENEVDPALITRPRAGGEPFRIAQVTAFFLRDLQPPPQVVQAINNKIAQEQQIATERHRVEVARLQAEQQRLLNQTLTAEALTKQYLEVLHDLRTSSNLVLMGCRRRGDSDIESRGLEEESGEVGALQHRPSAGEEPLQHMTTEKESEVEAFVFFL